MTVLVLILVFIICYFSFDYQTLHKTILKSLALKVLDAYLIRY